ncbi:MAG: peptide deformylase [Sulfobacillus benefaciens]|uniref:Peptide deformylase n=1 Tax=Sulfobacillus benefaciens TaxID=453960 RepID=A0A2T2XG64_9FIRM|nr:MAG: peptide deformylase [Sulfobacillus benefaciens]
MQKPIWTIATQNQFLRQRTVKPKQINQKVTRVVTDLFDTWDTVAAYGIAAPQIGNHLRLFIWKGSTMDRPEVIINPKIIRARGELKDYDGCLSVPGIYGETRRAAMVEITGLDVEGNSIRRTYEGFDARIIQHEIDHLEGVLFLDRIDDLDDLYVLEKVEDTESEDSLHEKRPLTESVRDIVVSARRPLPGHALIW